MIKTYKLFLSAFMLFSSSLLFAQSSDKQDSTLMYINGEGLQLNVGKADKTKFNLLTTVQSGFSMSQFDSASNTVKSNRLSLNLVRMALTVTGLKDKISLGIVTDFTSTMPILEGWVGLSVFNKHGKLFLGQRQTHTNNRLAMADERYWFMGQTQAGKSQDGTATGGLIQNFVGATREGGVFLETSFKFKKWVINPSVSITTGEGQNFFNTQNNVGFKYGGRLDVMPLGEFIKRGAFIAQDIYREPRPKLAFGFAASYNAKVSSPIGSDNGIINGIYNKNGIADFADYTKLVADMIFKYNGFAFVAEYMNASISGKELYTNVGATKKMTSDVASSFYNIGSALNIQSSYVTKNGWSMEGRYTIITPEFNLTSSLVQKQNWYTLGISKFLKYNALKLGLNVSYVDETMPTIQTKQWLGNMAVQILL